MPTLPSFLSEIFVTDEPIYKGEDLSNTIYLREDWSNNLVAGDLGWTVFTTGGGASVVIDNILTTSNRFGIVRKRVTAVGQIAGLNLGTANLLAGGGFTLFDTLIRIEDLATVAQDYIFRVGFGDTTSVADFTDGIYFEYDRSSSVNWRIATANTAVRTKVSSAVVVAEDTWIRLMAVLNKAGTQVDFYIQTPSPSAWVLLGSITTNIPTGAGTTFGSITKLQKTAGVGARDIFTDFYQLYFAFNTSR
jgi:hypothetical protein